MYCVFPTKLIRKESVFVQWRFLNITATDTTKRTVILFSYILTFLSILHLSSFYPSPCLPSSHHLFHFFLILLSLLPHLRLLRLFAPLILLFLLLNHLLIILLPSFQSPFFSSSSTSHPILLLFFFFSIPPPSSPLSTSFLPSFWLGQLCVHGLKAMSFGSTTGWTIG